MSSPPSLTKLTISDPPIPRPESPTDKPEEPSQSVETPKPSTPTTATPPPQSSIPSEIVAPSRPIPQTTVTSPAPLSNGTGTGTGTGARAGAGSLTRGPPMATRPPVAGRGGMPMPMGMRGSVMGGGGGQMQSRLPPSLQAKMDKIAASRSSGSQPNGNPTLHNGPNGPNPSATSMSALLRSAAFAAPSTAQPIPGPASGPLGLAARRSGARPNLGTMGMGASAPGGMGMGARAAGGLGGRRGPPGGMTLSGMAGAKKEEEGNKFSDFGKIMDPSGSLKFSSKAVLHANGVDFSNGQSFKINMDEMEVQGELGKGNYGTVQKVFHRPTGVMMAMKEIRLELDDSKLNGIIMELDILHRAVAPEIVEFYGAFTIESCVYYCMEFMDAGSLDTLTGGGVPISAKDLTKGGNVKPGVEANGVTSPSASGENGVDGNKTNGEGDESRELMVPEPVLRRITAAVVRGLGFLKDELQIMHRDVKPTNVLINKKGEVKLCDFGVSGQLEKSLAKTNIGCQSYMAPERIKGESQNQLSTYTVSSDVWSVGLSIIELAKGCYPYPPETFANVFAQLQAIVYGPAPTLPPGYSAEAQDFVAKCLIKDPNARPTYAELLQHPFLLADKTAEVDMPAWVAQALERRAARGITPLQEIEA